MLGSISIYVLGALVCGVSGDLTSFTVGRMIMALDGASFMTSARLMVNLLPPGPGRFVGVKVFATGLASGTAAAPFLSSLVLVEDTWHAIFWLLIAGATAAGVLCARFLPTTPIHEDERSPSSPANILLLSVSTFFLLYVLQRSYYDCYNESIILLAFALLAALGVYIFFHAEHAKDAPFLNVKDLMQSRYFLGVGLFCFTYIVLGSNNYILPYFLQTGLGYSWDTIGTFQAFGIGGALLTWFARALVIPNYPGPKKFFVIGFSALISFGLLLASLTLDANMSTNILPALVLNGCFVMLVLATAAMQTFRDVTPSRRLVRSRLPDQKHAWADRYGHRYHRRHSIPAMAYHVAIQQPQWAFQRWRSAVPGKHATLGAVIHACRRYRPGQSDFRSDTHPRTAPAGNPDCQHGVFLGDHCGCQRGAGGFHDAEDLQVRRRLDAGRRSSRRC